MDPPPRGAPSTRTVARRRLPILALGGLGLLTGLWSGLARLGWGLPLPHAEMAIGHGPLMVGGFLGTVIGLERAVALGRAPAYAGPVLTGLGTVAVLAGGPWRAGAALFLAGSLVLVAASLLVFRRQRALFTATLAAGALCWAAGNALWLAGRPVFEVVPWWMAFLVLTIAGERVELSRVRRPPPAAGVAFVLAAGPLVAGAAVVGPAPVLGARLAGAGLLALAAWLFRYDIARVTIRRTGLPRYVATCILSGLAWLAVAGLLALTRAPLVAGPDYDAVLHGVFVGFVFAMIFGHAPIILPAVLSLTVPFRPAFYAPLALLHLSLAIRIAGDLAAGPALRLAGGLLNTVAILAFLALTAHTVRRARTTAARPILP